MSEDRIEQHSEADVGQVKAIKRSLNFATDLRTHLNDGGTSNDRIDGAKVYDNFCDGAFALEKDIMMRHKSALWRELSVVGVASVNGGQTVSPSV